MDPNAQNLPSSTHPPAPPPSQQASNDPNQLKPPVMKPPTPESPKSSKKIILAVLLLAILLLALGGIAAVSIFVSSESEQEAVSEVSMEEDVVELDAKTTPIAKTPADEMTDWLSYTDSGKYFTLRYPPDFNVIPVEGNTSDVFPGEEDTDIDVNCVYVVDTEVFTPTSKTIITCYAASPDLTEIYPEILDKEQYEEIDLNGYSAYKRLSDEISFSNSKYYIMDGVSGFLSFDSLNADEDMFEKVVSTLTFN